MVYMNSISAKFLTKETKQRLYRQAHLNRHSRLTLLKVALQFNFHGFTKENIIYINRAGKLIYCKNLATEPEIPE